jgi:hypothetical protein
MESYPKFHNEVGVPIVCIKLLTLTEQTGT